jgi:hypothetical protein
MAFGHQPLDSGISFFFFTVVGHWSYGLNFVHRSAAGPLTVKEEKEMVKRLAAQQRNFDKFHLLWRESLTV